MIVDGDVTKFETGAVRSSDRAGERWDLISPIGLQEVAETCHEGSVKYGDFNWEKGMPVNDLLNHAIAHIYRYLGGDRSEKHLAHAAWGLLAAIHSDKLWKDLNRNLRGPNCTPPCLESRNSRHGCMTFWSSLAHGAKTVVQRSARWCFATLATCWRPTAGS